jgi:Leucine-rich repeat (LRR) protein
MEEAYQCIEKIKKFLRGQLLVSFKLGVKLLENLEESQYINDKELLELLTQTEEKRAVCFEQGLLYIFNGHKEVVLFNCKIEKIPSNIGQLKDLEALNLQNNKIKDIPIEIVALKKLDRLYLANNQLTKIPKYLNNIPNVRSINLTDNNISKQEIIATNKWCRKGLDIIV